MQIKNKKSSFVCNNVKYISLTDLLKDKIDSVDIESASSLNFPLKLSVRLNSGAFTVEGEITKSGKIFIEFLHRIEIMLQKYTFTKEQKRIQINEKDITLTVGAGDGIFTVNDDVVSTIEDFNKLLKRNMTNFIGFHLDRNLICEMRFEVTGYFAKKLNKCYKEDFKRLLECFLHEE